MLVQSWRMRVGITINFLRMKTKNLESFKLLKFELKGSQVIGGNLPTTYGRYYDTSHGTDTARTTYNSQSYPQPNSGEDNLSYKS